MAPWQALAKRRQVFLSVGQLHRQPDVAPRNGTEVPRERGRQAPRFTSVKLAVGFSKGPDPLLPGIPFHLAAKAQRSQRDLRSAANPQCRNPGHKSDPLDARPGIVRGRPEQGRSALPALRRRRQSWWRWRNWVRGRNWPPVPRFRQPRQSPHPCGAGQRAADGAFVGGGSVGGYGSAGMAFSGADATGGWAGACPPA